MTIENGVPAGGRGPTSRDGSILERSGLKSRSVWPSKRRLAAINNRWSHERVPDAGEAMADWLRIFSLAVRAGDRRNVVIIPILH